MKRLLLGLLSAGALLAAPPQVKVRLRNAHVELPLERYVTGVLAGESSVFQSAEALKAMAVAARTYAVRLRGRHSAEGFDFCDTAHCQRLDFDAIPSRLEAAAAGTAGELLWFEGKPAFTPYTGDCGGRTEDAAAAWPDQAAPYLKSRADEYCVRAGDSSWQWTSGWQQITRVLQRSGLRGPRSMERVAIAERTPSGRVRVLLLSGGGEPVRLSASSFRFAVGRELSWNTLPSDRYEVHSAGDQVIFEGSGTGHGVGLCQRGTEQMGKAGRGYREILAYYYPGTSLGVTGRGLSWQRLSGETITLLTVRPDRDGAVLGTAERLAQSLSQRTRWAIPQSVEIRVYPDVDTFRDATGEPGWVAGYTEGRRIHLQPGGRGLAHELAHALIESQAATGLPLWFREGLADYLVQRKTTQAGAQGAPRVLQDSDMRQRGEAERARRAYAEAASAVSGLVKRYGEAAVLDWVKRGLPPEVMKASASSAAAKSK